VRYVEDMKKATLPEFDKEEAEWRETAERQVAIDIATPRQNGQPAPYPKSSPSI
jgi:hypothetical protein